MYIVDTLEKRNRMCGFQIQISMQAVKITWKTQTCLSVVIKNESAVF